MPVPVIANRVVEIDVPRDANADINKNVDSDNLVTDIGVNVAPSVDPNLRDLPSMPANKTRIEKDFIHVNPRNGKPGVYQR